MSAELAFVLRLAFLSGVIVGLEYLANRRKQTKKARLPRFFWRNRTELPEAWQCALGRTYGERHG